jgi:predicted ribosomally synthesized peptide with SipW-like signal peptide
MKLRKTLASILALVLVAAISVVGTLAYLKDTSEVVTNTFTVGKVYIELKEKPVGTDGKVTDGADYTETGNTYHIYPGLTYDKAVAVLVGEAGKESDKVESEDCYLFIKLTNGLANFEATGNTTIAAQLEAKGWTLADEEAGIWQYATKVSNNAVVPLFDTITISDTYDGSTTPDKIEIVACAVQAAGLEIADALAEAKTAFAG